MEKPFSESIVIKICGSAGDGSISAVEILNRAVASMGYHILNFDSYPAEIRGFGKSCGMTRISRTRVLTPGTRTHCLISLNDQHSITELPTLSSDAMIIYDDKPPRYMDEDEAIAGFVEPGMTGYGLPLRELSVQAMKSAKARNIIALGAISAVLHLPLNYFEEAIKTRFAQKSESVRMSNLDALYLGYEYAVNHPQSSFPYNFKEKTYSRNEDISIISGNEAAAKGCIEAGIAFFAGYPITPATKILEIMAKELPKLDRTTVQTEDEISAIGHVIGAGFAGERAATATSGPGLCLMVETINLAVMAEIPAVIIDSQRGGPSTGLPTKTEQSDLNLAIFGGSGDSPRVVLAPANVEECFTLTKTAFDVAQAYQTPVIVLLDFYLSNRIEDIDESVFSESQPSILNLPDPDKSSKPFHRFADSTSGISPRALPGDAGFFHAVTGLEHTTRGKPNYDAENHVRMTQKRFRKFKTLEEKWPEVEIYYPLDAASIGVISWGSSIGSAKEAIQMLNSEGISSSGFFPRLLYPMRKDDLVNFARKCQILVSAELNFTGQLANLVEQITHRSVIRACSVAAEPLHPESIVEAARGHKR